MSLAALRPNRRALLLGAAAAAALSLPAPIAFAASPEPGFGRDQNFDLGWTFFKGDGAGFEAPDFDDSAWRRLDLPHDWSLENLPPINSGVTRVIGPFDRRAEGGAATGFTVGGEGWYRKRFALKPPAGGGTVEVVFDGVYMNSDVWLNGRHLGAHGFGYTGFAYDLTPHLAQDGANVLVVRVRNLGKNSRWYSGSGVYRHVWLNVLADTTRIARFGVGVVTRRVTAAEADLEIDTRLEGPREGVIRTARIRDARGRTVWRRSAPAGEAAPDAARIRAPALWSPHAPALYTLETELRRGRRVIDRVVTSFGIRVVAFDGERGMTLNGEPIKLRGGCLHHDNGLLGAAAFDAAERRKVRLLKARGFNAVRPSHNPFSPAFLEACDREGIMVVSEAFDQWRAPKLENDYSTLFEANWREDLTTMILGQRNHPSIIMWSIGNEISQRNSAGGVEAQWRLANHARTLDPTRPVTAGVNEFAGRPVTASPAAARPGTAGQVDRPSTIFLDVIGFNYRLRSYAADHAAYPDRPLYGSESFPRDVFRIWDLTERSPWLMGDFVWTAQDYLGEAGLGGSSYVAPGGAQFALNGWPTVLAGCGDVDLIGQPKAAAFARDVVWGLSPIELLVQTPPPVGKIEAVTPWGWSDERKSWTWPGAEGRPLAVRVYSRADRVDLYLDGVLLERRTLEADDLHQAEFQTSYRPGVLEAVGYREGREIGRSRLETAGPAAALRLRPESEPGAGRGDVTYLQIEVVDAEGRRVPNATAPLVVTLSGPVELAAFGSASPKAVPGFHAATAATYDGRALLVLRGVGVSGRAVASVSAEGLAGATATLDMRPVPPRTGPGPDADIRTGG